MLRRTSRFQDLLREYRDARYPEEILNQVIEFGIALAEIGCAKYMKVQDAEEYAQETEGRSAEEKREWLLRRVKDA